ncbi:hypothetical protein EJ110_NYTH28305 [Nymphaea thermarum]|nr:hypothetical protein EJ110_NYTH28305 [Nymphaea thermarum]
MMNVRLEILQQLILDNCTSLTKIPDYVGGLKCLPLLSLKGCSSLKRLFFSIGSLVVLEELILDHCTSLTEIPDYCLRCLSLKGCSSLNPLSFSIGMSVTMLPYSLGNLKSVHDLSNLTGLEELNVEKYRSLANQP